MSPLAIACLIICQLIHNSHSKTIFVRHSVLHLTSPVINLKTVKNGSKENNMKNCLGLLLSPCEQSA